MPLLIFTCLSLRLCTNQLAWPARSSAGSSFAAINNQKRSCDLSIYEDESRESWTGMMIIIAAIIILLWANQWTELAAAVSLRRMCWQRVVIHPQWTSKTGARPNMMRRQKQNRLLHSETPRLLGDNLISDTIKLRLHQSWWGNSQRIKARRPHLARVCCDCGFIENLKCDEGKRKCD